MTQAEYLKRAQSTMKLRHKAQRKLGRALEDYEVAMRQVRDELHELAFDVVNTEINDFDKQAVARENSKADYIINSLGAIRTLVNPF